MLATILPVVLSMLTELANLTTSSSTIGNILTTLINLLPTIEQEVADLTAPVQNVIAALSANPATTAQQLAVAQALDAQDDAAFEAAVQAYNAANPDAPIVVPSTTAAPPATPAAPSS
jgi:hypothetical protein